MGGRGKDLAAKIFLRIASLRRKREGKAVKQAIKGEGKERNSFSVGVRSGCREGWE